MNLSMRQIRAARALLDLSQSELAKMAGLSKNGLSDLEQGKVSPRGQTLTKLQRIFEAQGVELLDHDGVRMRRDIFKVNFYEGDNLFVTHFQDLIETMRQQNITACHHSDDVLFVKKYPDAFFWYYSQMLQHGLKERLIIPDTKLFRYAPYSTTECRISPPHVFGTVGYSVYGDKFALYMPSRLIVIENKDIAETYRKQFEFDWKRSHALPHMTPQYEKEQKKRHKQ